MNSSYLGVGVSTQALLPTSGSLLRPPGSGLTSTPRHCLAHPVQGNQSSSSDQQQTLGSALSMTDLIMSEGEVILPEPQMNSDSLSTDTQQDNQMMRVKGLTQACPHPPGELQFDPLMALPSVFPRPPELHPSQPNKGVGLQDLYPGVSAFLAQFGPAMAPPATQSKADPPLLLSLAHHQSGEEFTPPIVPPPLPANVSLPVLLRMPPDPLGPPLYHSPIPPPKAPFSHPQKPLPAPSAGPVQEYSLPHIPVRPFVPVLVPPPTTQHSSHTLPVLALGDPLSQMQREGFQMLHLPQPCVITPPTAEDRVLPNTRGRGQASHRNQARWVGSQDGTVDDDQITHRNQSRRVGFHEDRAVDKSVAAVQPSRKRCVCVCVFVIMHTSITNVMVCVVRTGSVED